MSALSALFIAVAMSLAAPWKSKACYLEISQRKEQMANVRGCRQQRVLIEYICLSKDAAARMRIRN